MQPNYKKENYYLKYLHLFTFGAICLVLVDVLQLEIPKMVSDIYNGLEGAAKGSSEFDKTNLFSILLKMLVFVLITMFGRFWWRFFIIGASRNIEEDIRNKLFEKCVQLSPNFYSKNKVGDLMAYFTNDLSAVRNLYGHVFLMLVDILFLSTLTIYYMLKINVQLTIVAMIPLVIITMVGLLMNKNVKKRYAKQQRSFASLSDFVQESISGISVTKSCTNEDNQINNFEKKAEENYIKTIQAERLSLVTKMIVSIFTGLNLVIILSYGGYLVIEKNLITSGELVAFIMYIGMMVWPMRAIGHLVVSRALGKVSMNRINNLLMNEVETVDSIGVEKDFVINGNIEFKGLDFYYANGNVVLKNISFEIKKGDFVGIIGRTGCGKTTLVELLLRLYKVDNDKIFVDGLDINTIPLEILREAIGFVPQDNYLFSDKISNNISLSQKNKKNDELIVKAAKEADIHDNIIKFIDGYDTIVGERGVTLSGGQKQRVSIARALYKSPKILILDDSLSAVDTKTEENILSTLKNEYAKITKILVSHRVSTIKNADKIILMDKGEILDMGTHFELLNRCEEYKKIVERQKLEEHK